MCGRFELITEFQELPKVLKQTYPRLFKSGYETRNLIRPTDSIIAIKKAGKLKATFMSWGFLSPNLKDPFDIKNPRPFNARSETVETKKFFSSSWKHKRCLIPASGFFEKKYRFRKENYETFWLGGIWSSLIKSDGTELESCCVLTTKANDLVRPVHNRMPIIVPDGYEAQWTQQVKYNDELKVLTPIMMGWNPKGWLVEEVNKKLYYQFSLFN